MENKITWLTIEFGREFTEWMDKDAVNHYYISCHDYDMGVTDADDYAWLNTLLRYDIGAERALEIIRWYYENLCSTVQDAVDINQKENLKVICEFELGLNLDFSHWPKTEPQYLEYGFKTDEFKDYMED